MIAGARVDVAPYRQGDMDFVLWKPSAAQEPGWESPWGRGRPGWHIECSAMSWKHLGETFDIHGGGIDLVFPHHENEIAQSRCAFGHEVMANVWMHNGFLQVEGEKMSKSLGNFITIHDLLQSDTFGGRRWPGAVLRLAMLRTHYRQPIDWTLKGLEEAEANLRNWHEAEVVSAPEGAEIPAQILAALCEDLNTPEAISLIHALRKAGKARELKSVLMLMGLYAPDVFAKAGAGGAGISAEERSQIEAVITQRLAARAAKNFAESDRLRDHLLAKGIVLKDNKDGTTTWEHKG